MKEYLAYENDASRSELFIRMVYSEFIITIISLYYIIGEICRGLQALGILLLGKRNEFLTNVIIGQSEYFIQVLPYICLLTDERPGVMPKELKVFVNNREYLNFEQEASRLELIVRIFYSLPINIVAGIFGFLLYFILILQWLCILLTGGRSEGLNSFIQTFIKYIIQIISYLTLVTDERPNILPANIDVSLELASDDKVETSMSGGIIKTTPRLSQKTRNKHIALSIVLMFVLYIISVAFYFMMMAMLMSRAY